MNCFSDIPISVPYIFRLVQAIAGSYQTSCTQRPPLIYLSLAKKSILMGETLRSYSSTADVLEFSLKITAGRVSAHPVRCWCTHVAVNVEVCLALAQDELILS